MLYEEIYGDLFKVDSSYTLAHCISADCKMGAGIAKLFVKHNPEMRKVLQSVNPKISDAICYTGGNRHNVINLITKERYFHKPTRENFNKAIIEMKRLALSYNIKKIAIPQIGSGLDRLNWKESSKFIREVFSDTDIEILVCIK